MRFLIFPSPLLIRLLSAAFSAEIAPEKNIVTATSESALFPEPLNRQAESAFTIMPGMHCSSLSSRVFIVEQKVSVFSWFIQKKVSASSLFIIRQIKALPLATPKKETQQSCVSYNPQEKGDLRCWPHT